MMWKVEVKVVESIIPKLEEWLQLIDFKNSISDACPEEHC